MKHTFKDKDHIAVPPKLSLLRCSKVENAKGVSTTATHIKDKDIAKRQGPPFSWLNYAQNKENDRQKKASSNPRKDKPKEVVMRGADLIEFPLTKRFMKRTSTPNNRNESKRKDGEVAVTLFPTLNPWSKDAEQEATTEPYARGDKVRHRRRNDRGRQRGKKKRGNRKHLPSLHEKLNITSPHDDDGIIFEEKGKNTQPVKPNKSVKSVEPVVPVIQRDSPSNNVAFGPLYQRNNDHQRCQDSPSQSNAQTLPDIRVPKPGSRPHTFAHERCTKDKPRILPEKNNSTKPARHATPMEQSIDATQPRTRWPEQYSFTSQEGHQHTMKQETGRPHHFVIHLDIPAKSTTIDICLHPAWDPIGMEKPETKKWVASAIRGGNDHCCRCTNRSSSSLHRRHEHAKK